MYSLRRTGLGDCMSSSDISAQLPPLQNCSVFDSACVASNQQISDALNDLVDGGCIAPGTPISFTPNTSAAAVNAFMSNTPVNTLPTVGGVVDTGTPQYSLTPVFTPSGAAAPTTDWNPPQSAPVATVKPVSPLVPAVPVAIASPGAAPVGASSNTSSSSTAPTDNWFTDSMFAGIPNWGLVAAGGVLLLMMMGGSHGK
jgi:hypothetical protein